MMKNTILDGLEYFVSKLGHPNTSIFVSNLLIENQNISGYENANIGRNCTLRGDIDLGEDVIVPDGCELKVDVDIEKRTKIGADCEVIGDVKIGKYCAIARNVTFQQLNHPVDRPSMSQTFYDKFLDSKLHHISNGPITVGNDVWIGTNVIVLSGVTIGDGAVIGAGSVVTDDVDPYEVVGGTPAEHLKWRFSKDIREKLLDISWWDWNDEELLENNDFFHTKIETLADIEGSINR